MTIVFYKFSEEMFNEAITTLFGANHDHAAANLLIYPCDANLRWLHCFASGNVEPLLLVHRKAAGE